MESEPDEGLDAFLRRAAQVAAVGAAVGAAFGAARAARGHGAEEDSPQASATEEGDEPAESEEREEPKHRDEELAQAGELEERPAGREPEPPAEAEPPGEEREDEPLDQHAQQGAEREAAPDGEPEQPESREAEPTSETGDGQVAGEAASIIGRALPQIEQLTGRDTEGVLGVRRNGDGWLLTIEVVELPRIPSSTDVLATYDVSLDDDGGIREYRRTGRYVRGRGDASGQ